MAWTRITVNRNVVDHNKRHGLQEPVLTVKSQGKTFYGDELEILNASGHPDVRVLYRPLDPLPCGASVWIETLNNVRIRNLGQEVALPGAMVRRGVRLKEFLAEHQPPGTVA